MWVSIPGVMGRLLNGMKRWSAGTPLDGNIRIGRRPDGGGSNFVAVRVADGPDSSMVPKYGLPVCSFTSCGRWLFESVCRDRLHFDAGSSYPKRSSVSLRGST